jgi:hypothetical protein
VFRFKKLFVQYCEAGVGLEKFGALSPRKKWTPMAFYEASKGTISRRNYNNWFTGDSVPEPHFVGIIQRVFWGPNEEVEAEKRHELREARNADHEERQASQYFKVFGTDNLDPFGEHWPEDAGDCYEDLFPIENERDPFEHIRYWVQLAHHNPKADWREFVCTMREQGKCIGFCFLSLHWKSQWWFGNFFGLLPGNWRESHRVERFMRVVIAKCQAIAPNAKGIIFEVERYDEKKITALVSRCDVQSREKNRPVVKLTKSEDYSAKAVLRLAWYSIHGLGRVTGGELDAFGVFLSDRNDQRFMNYIQPALEKFPDRKAEVPLWLMIYPLEPLREKMKGIGRDSYYKLSELDVDEIFTFLYERLFPSAYEKSEPTASRTAKEGYAAYAKEVRKRVEGGINGKWLILVRRVFSASAYRLIARYGRKKLGLK